MVNGYCISFLVVRIVFHFVGIVNNASLLRLQDDGSNENWVSLDADLVMQDGEVVATKNPTGHSVLINCHFEQPFGELLPAMANSCQLGFHAATCLPACELVWAAAHSADSHASTTPAAPNTQHGAERNR